MGHSVSVQVRYARAGNLAGCGKIILHTRTSMVRTWGTGAQGRRDERDERDWRQR